MVLETQTLLFLWTPIAIFSAIIVWLFGRMTPEVRGTNTWAIATICVGVTGYLFSGRSTQPYLLTVIVSSTMFAAGNAIFHLAACHLRNTRYPIFVHISIVTLIIASSGFLFRDLKADYVARVLVFCPAITIQYVLIVRTLIGDRQAVSSEEYKVLALGAMPFALIAISQIWRTLIHLPGITTPPGGILSNQANVQVTYIMVVVALIFTPYVFILISSVRARLLVQRNEHKLRQQTDLLEHAPVLVRNLKDKIIMWNNGMVNLYGFSSSEALGKVSHDLLQTRFPIPLSEVMNAIHTKGKWEGELEHKRSDGRSVWVTSLQMLHIDDHGKPAAIIEVNNDITERRQMEEERKVTIDFLHMVNASTQIREMIRSAVTLFQNLSGCEAVGIRLRDGDDYPYYEARGFTKEFVLLENKLCTRDGKGNIVRDDTGNPLIECMCGNIISGHFDPSKPFFTAQGSFWSNNTSELLATTSDADRRARTRNRCNGEGYESVALIPLVIGEERLGLLQLNDRRKGVFSLEAVELWERFAGYLAIALSKFHTEETLKQSEERYRALFQEMTEGFALHEIVVNEHGKPIDYLFKEVNPAFERLTGLTGKDIINKRVTQVLPGIENDPAGWIEVYGKVALTGQAIHFENYSSSLNKYYEVYAYCPAPLHFAALLLDITERKKMESLRQSSAYHRSLLEASLDPLVTIDANGKITDVNYATEVVTGYSRTVLISTDFSGYFTEPEKARMGYQQVFDKGTIKDYELEIKHKDGHTTPVLYNASVYHDEARNPVGVFAAARDITERRKAEEVIRKLNMELEARVVDRTAQLENSNRELQAFAYSVSHDLRAPLRSIEGFSQALLDDYSDKLDDTGKDYIDTVRKAVLRMGQLIDDLLKLSRVTRSEMNLETVDLSAIAHSVADTLKKHKPERQTDFIIADGLMIYGDGRLLAIVLENLLSNAWKFSANNQKSIIEFGSMLQKGKTIYFVKDNGVGFDMAYADKLFVPFQRLHRPDEFQGTGIGLVTAKRIVERHSGKIWIESLLGSGTTVYFTF